MMKEVMYSLFGLSYALFIGCLMLMWNEKNKNIPVARWYFMIAFIPVVNIGLAIFMAFQLLFTERKSSTPPAR